MKNYLEKWRQFINESSLSRLYGYVQKYDCAILTGYRDNVNDTSQCISDDEIEKALNSKEPNISNKTRNRDIKSFLLSRKYGVTSVDGSYVENFDTPEAIEVKEKSLFVVNLSNNTRFVNDIVKLGIRYCQDSVLIIPKGKKAYLVGTNKVQEPGYLKKIVLGKPKFGKESQFMTKIKNKSFTIDENLQTWYSLSRLQKMAVSFIGRDMEKLLEQTKYKFKKD